MRNPTLMVTHPEASRERLLTYRWFITLEETWTGITKTTHSWSPRESETFMSINLIVCIRYALISSQIGHKEAIETLKKDIEQLKAERN